jgi:hypothetical protein
MNGGAISGTITSFGYDGGVAVKSNASRFAKTGGTIYGYNAMTAIFPAG